MCPGQRAWEIYFLLNKNNNIFIKQKGEMKREMVANENEADQYQHWSHGSWNKFSLFKSSLSAFIAILLSGKAQSRPILSSHPLKWISHTYARTHKKSFPDSNEKNFDSSCELKRSKFQKLQDQLLNCVRNFFGVFLRKYLQ